MLLQSFDVHDIFVEPFISSGFRLPNQPYSYYFRSLFSLHNETISVWIHLIGTLILVIQVCQHVSYLTMNSYSIYILYNCFGACLMLLCSAQAHLFHSRTLADHLRSFYLDYFGINFYGFTSGIILYKFSHRHNSFSNETSYYLLLSLFSLYSISISCFCKTFYRRPYPFSHKILQCSGVLLVYIYQIWPILKTFFTIWIFPIHQIDLNESEEKALFWHLIQFLSFILSGLFFIGKIPERFFPGLFDLFGQSHHTFHLTIFLVAYSQANAVFQDIISKSSNHSQFNLYKDIYYTLVVFCLQLASVVFWLKLSRPILERRYQIDKNK